MKSKKYTFLIILFLAISGCESRNVTGPFPVVQPDRVIFENGRKVSYSGDTIALQNNIIQPEMDKPVNMIEQVLTVPEWKRIIIETKYGYYEDSGLVFRFYNHAGKLLKKTPEYFGDFELLFMTKVNRFVLIQTSAHYTLTEGYILDTDGKQLQIIAQKPDAFDAVVSAEGDLFIVEYSRMSKGVSFITVEVFTADGEMVATHDFSEGGAQVIELGDRKIQINLRDPKTL